MDGSARLDPDPRLQSLILDGLRGALAGPGEHRLFRAGKFQGLFVSRAGAAGEAAEAALNAGFLDKVRTETRGKTLVEWVKLTPRGVDYLHAHESPQAVLRDLHETLQLTRDGVPTVFDGFRTDLHELSKRLELALASVLTRLDTLTARVEAAIRRTETEPARRNGLQEIVPWAMEALAYLDRRSTTGVTTPCNLPELFAALALKYPDLTLTSFHDGLRRLQDLRALELQPGDPTALAEPEYALLDGPRMLYHVSRQAA